MKDRRKNNPESLRLSTDKHTQACTGNREDASRVHDSHIPGGAGTLPGNHVTKISNINNTKLYG